jgi:hypothetical protein
MILSVNYETVLGEIEQNSCTVDSYGMYYYYFSLRQVRGKMYMVKYPLLTTHLYDNKKLYDLQRKLQK